MFLKRWNCFVFTKLQSLLYAEWNEGFLCKISLICYFIAFKSVEYAKWTAYEHKADVFLYAILLVCVAISVFLAFLGLLFVAVQVSNVIKKIFLIRWNDFFLQLRSFHIFSCFQNKSAQFWEILINYKLQTLQIWQTVTLDYYIVIYFLGLPGMPKSEARRFALQGSGIDCIVWKYFDAP